MAAGMKKKQKQTNPHGVTSIAIGSDLESAIRSHSDFFDHLIELIPARFYLTNDDESKPWYQGLSKVAKASLKQQSKKNTKLARRTRFDPDNDPSTLHLHQQQINKAEEGDDEHAKPIDLDESKESSVTYEELQQRLHRKLQLLRGNRGEKKIDERKGKNDRDKRKRRGEGNSRGESGKEVHSEDGGESGKEVHSEDDDDGEEIIEYGKVKLGDEDDGKQGKKNKKRKLSKGKELKIAKKIQEVKKDNPFIAKRESWKAATSRAMGEKVHDNPRLIEASMKREKKKKAKNAEKWKDRVETQEKMKGERQRKRKENIDGRINDKKMRKIAKREKKLTRPGFEGRKDGFITDQ